jgi:hypothetical protein
MRLLNTKTYELKDFLDDRVPEYVILSHRWSQDETSFKDFRKGLNANGTGYRKIIDFCSFARSRVREWVWIDTCCIDKRSSAEVSEAVNSMYNWYQQARECYVFLRDVPPLSHGRTVVLRRMMESEWFTRGWTLQEMLAPPSVVFLTWDWEIIGDKVSLARDISSITGIPEALLEAQDSLLRSSVAQKMSWASKRQTTKPEDMAYCMLGLFGVNMPLLYGEGGPKAFKRLQLHIISDSDDESIFAWSALTERILYRADANRQTMLAYSVRSFADAGTIMQLPPTNQLFTHRPHYAMTNKGLLYQGPAQHLLQDRDGRDAPGLYIIHLNCFGTTCARWPIVICRPLPEHLNFIRIYTNWSPEQIDAEFPNDYREDVVLSHAYVL